MCLAPVLIWGDQKNEVKNSPGQGGAPNQVLESNVNTGSGNNFQASNSIGSKQTGNDAQSKQDASPDPRMTANDDDQADNDGPESEEDVIESIMKRDSKANADNSSTVAPPSDENSSYRTDLNRRIHPREALVTDALPSVQGHMGPEIYEFPMPENALFERFFRSFLKPERKKIMQAIFNKAVMYRSYISGRVSEKSVPAELLYLPVIESAFSPKAVSVVGARGLWQFMPGTARHLGLVIDDWVDERQDFWKATNAALTKLKEDQEFLGDWYLALAAYHCGTGRVLQAIKMSKNGCRDYWELCARGLLPRATTYYVPSFLAACKIASYPGRYGFALSWDTSPEWQTVELDRMVDLEILANLTNMPFDLLKAGNAELKGYFTPPSLPHYALKIPAPYVEKVQACLQDARINLIKYQYHIIRSGDTLYGLSRYYGIKEELIRKANPDLRATAMRIGATVKIPVPEGVRMAVQKPKPRAPDSKLPFSHEYTVSKGDTLWSIAKLFGISLDELVAKNNMTISSVIRVGEKLKVPSPLSNANSSASEG